MKQATSKAVVLRGQRESLPLKQNGGQQVIKGEQSLIDAAAQRRTADNHSSKNLHLIVDLAFTLTIILVLTKHCAL
eukprot:1155986-Pelagomonas_calceolata.AAC.2